MTLKFKYESDSICSVERLGHCSTLEVEVDAYADSEDEACVNDLTIWSAELNREIKLTELSPEEQATVQQYAEDLANERAHEMYYEAQSDRAEAAYDAWKEGDAND